MADLQEWWAELHGIDEEQAKRGLYMCLLQSLPERSPLFEAFCKSFSSNIQEFPALLPEVWLHWDPKTIRARGAEAFGHFLMLFSHEIRVVIEIDGCHHYANQVGDADSDRYAEMVKADRELQLAGYEVYRFSVAEIAGSKNLDSVKDFFARLFEHYRVPLR